ncbi:MAG: type I glutamate--ammonia ligase, partial [Gemmatimonadetes bacterium]|nr:type I glutamate--ammonia ligase [Gemmatimonadota bacterium]
MDTTTTKQGAGGRMDSTQLSLDQIRTECDGHEVRFVQLQFVDILGVPKCVELPIQQLEKAYNNEMMFDGSSVHGFARINESDMALYPDWSTRIYEGSPDGTGGLLRVISDVYTDKMGADGARPYEGDPRASLKSLLAQVKSELGWDLQTGCEAEFFLFDAEALSEGRLVTHDDGGYFDVDPVDRGVLVRREITNALHDMGFEVEALHHEVAEGQHEIDFKYAGALQTADNLMKFKSLIKSFARDYGLQATFMPKPKAGINGNGMHTHVSIWKDGANIFREDGSKTYGLSQNALHFIAGVMEHAGAITAFGNPLVNSYKRLQPGYEAPTVIAYSLANRSPMIRLPKATGNSKRLEIRSPDPTANPYLLFTAIVAAGVDGVKRKLQAPEPITTNVYQESAAWREERGLKELPSSLGAALDALEADEVIKAAFSDHI